MTQGNILLRRNRRSDIVSHGFSLIETLVVMVVLLIGIFAILRLFPGGFLIIQRTSEITNAQAIANQQLQFQRSQITVPDSIVSATIDPATNTVTVDPTVAPDIIREYTKDDPGLPASISDPYYYSNVNRIRYTIGETFRIPISTSIKEAGYGSIYMLQNGPVFNQFQQTSPKTDGLAVYGVSMERIEQPATVAAGQYDDSVILQNDQQYVIDYDKMLIGFFPRKGTSINVSRLYHVSYDYYEQAANATPVLHTVLDATISVPDDLNLPTGTNLVKWMPLFNTTASPSPNSLPLPPLPANHTLVGLRRGSEEISRRFTLISTTPVNSKNGTAPLWSSDPYEYAWFSDQVGANANVGALIFNPRGHSTMVQTTQGPQPLTARVNYMTYDNHIIREMRAMPNQGPYSIKLTLPFILSNGDTLPDQTTYNGLFRDGSTQQSRTADILIYNANNGEKVAELQNGTPTTDSVLQNVVLDARNGIVIFPPYTSGPNNGKYEVEVKGLQNASLKIFYQAQKNWGQQLQKAQSHYTQADTPTSINYRSYLVGDGNNGTKPTRVYFPPSEAGKSVVLGEYWTNDLTGGGTPGTTPRRYANQLFQISDSTQTDTVTGFGPMVYIQVPDDTMASKLPRILDASQTGRAVTNVSGVSMRSRVIWANSATVSKDSNGNDMLTIRWRTVDQDTFLTPAPGQ